MERILVSGPLTPYLFCVTLNIFYLLEKKNSAVELPNTRGTLKKKKKKSYPPTTLTFWPSNLKQRLFSLPKVN